MQLITFSIREIQWAQQAMFDLLEAEAEARDISVANFVPPEYGSVTEEKYVIDIMQEGGIWSEMLKAVANGGMSRVDEFMDILDVSDQEWFHASDTV